MAGGLSADKHREASQDEEELLEGLAGERGMLSVVCVSGVVGSCVGPGVGYNTCVAERRAEAQVRGMLVREWVERGEGVGDVERVEWVCEVRGAVGAEWWVRVCVRLQTGCTTTHRCA